MKFGKRMRFAVDLCMTVILPFLMAYSMVGEETHEWLGTAMTVLFLLHHGMNLRRFASSGARRTPEGVFGILIDTLMLADMLIMAVTGVMISRHVFRFVHAGAAEEQARALHLLGSYWGFVLVSAHLGLHWSGIAGTIRSVLPYEGKLSTAKTLLQIIAGLVAAYGVNALIVREVGRYMFLRSQLVLIDIEEPLIYFLIDYGAMMVTFAEAGYLIRGLLLRIGAKARSAGGEGQENALPDDENRRDET